MALRQETRYVEGQPYTVFVDDATGTVYGDSQTSGANLNNTAGYGFTPEQQATLASLGYQQPTSQQLEGMGTSYSPYSKPGADSYVTSFDAAGNPIETANDYGTVFSGEMMTLAALFAAAMGVPLPFGAEAGAAEAGAGLGGEVAGAGAWGGAEAGAGLSGLEGLGSMELPGGGLTSGATWGGAEAASIASPLDYAGSVANLGSGGGTDAGLSLADGVASPLDYAGGAGSVTGSTASTMPSWVTSAATAMGVTPERLWSMVGSIGAAGLGAYASNEQTNALSDMATRYEGYGAPYRQKLSDLYANPESFLSSAEVQRPVQMGTDALMRSLSVQGNPFGSGNALQQGQSYASDQLFGKLGQEKDRLAGFGGLSSYSAAAPQISANAIQSSGNVYEAVGTGMRNIFDPPKSGAQTLADLLKQMR